MWLGESEYRSRGEGEVILRETCEKTANTMSELG